jgi:hypothetical protein
LALQAAAGTHYRWVTFRTDFELATCTLSRSLHAHAPWLRMILAVLALSKCECDVMHKGPYLKRVWGDAEKQDGSGVNAGLILTHLARGLAEVKLTHLR